MPSDVLVSPTRVARCAIVIALTNALAAPVFAADDAAARAQYEAERARCMSGAAGQDQAACLRSAGAAYEALKANRLADPNTNYRSNAATRCANLPPGQQRDCLSRVDGGGTASGSVQGGGIVRETVTPVVPPTPPQAPLTGPANPAVPATPASSAAGLGAPAMPSPAVPTAPVAPVPPTSPTAPLAK